MPYKPKYATEFVYAIYLHFLTPINDAAITSNNADVYRCLPSYIRVTEVLRFNLSNKDIYGSIASIIVTVN